MKTDSLSIKSNIKALIWTTKLAFRINKVSYSLLFFTMIVAEIVPVLMTLLGAQILNLIASGSTEFTNELIIILAGGLFLSFLLNIANDIRDYAIISFNYSFEVKAWEIFLRKTSKLDFQYLESPDYSILMHKVKEAVNWRGNNIAHYVPELTASFINLIFIGGIFLTLNPLFILLIVISEGLRFLINRKFGHSLFSFWDSNSEVKHHAWYAQHSLEKDDVLRESKIYNFSEAIINRYKTEVLSFNRDAKKQLNFRTILRTAMSFLDSIVFFGIQIWLLTQVFVKAIDIGGYSFYLTNISTVAKSLNNLQSALSWLSEQLPFMSEFKSYLDLEDLVVKPKDPITISQEAPSIEFKNVSFKYPGTDNFVLKDVSFKINAGEKIAIVGENGAGKTTIIKLMARFYDTTSGEILINGINIQEIDLVTYYKLWGVLFQSFAKLWFSVRENIGVGNLEDINNIELIKEAARKADAQEFINNLPKQYETLLSRDFKDGRDLSGGQWQKLGIARAVFASPKFIVLDEPTSALDALAEAEVFENIHKISKESTVLVISHRFSTVRNANKIIVIENGTISEQGNHEELLESNGLYKEMFNAQAEGYK